MMAGKTNIMPDFCSRKYPFHYITALNMLAGMGVDIHKIDILAVGEYENYKGEIREQQPRAGTTLTADTPITLKVGFLSAVDYMPYQFFYGLFGTRDSGGEWEDNARALMAPFDAAVIRHDAIAKFQSLKYDFGIIDRGHLLKVLELFNFSLPAHSNSLKDMLLWLSMLPTFHFWAGNPELIEMALAKVLGLDFEVVENTRSKYEIPESIRYHLGTKSGRLGRETVLGNSFYECDSSYEVIVKNVSPDKVNELLPGGATRTKIEWLLSFCMPDNLEYKIRVKVKKAKTIADRKKEQPGYLGYSTHI